MLNHMILFRAAMTRPGRQQARIEVQDSPRVIRALALTLGLACGATLAAAPITATGVRAFGFGDVWDAAKEVGGAVKDVTDAARDARNTVQDGVREAVGNAAKEVGGKLHDSIEDKVPSGVKDIGREAADIGRGAVDAKEALERNAKKIRLQNPFKFDPQPGTILKDKRKPRYTPGASGPTKSKDVARSPYKPGEWGGNATSRGKMGGAVTKGAPVDHGVSKAVSKGTDTGNPYPGYPGRSKPDRTYPGYPNKPSQTSKPGDAPAMKPVNAARDRSAAGRPLGNAKDRVPRDRSAAGRPLTTAPKPARSAPARTDKPARGKQTVIRDKRGKQTVVRDKRDKETKESVVRDKRKMSRKATDLTPKRVKRQPDHRAKRSVNHRPKRSVDHRSNRKPGQGANRTSDHRVKRKVDHGARRTMDHRSSRNIEKPRNRGVQMRSRGRQG